MTSQTFSLEGQPVHFQLASRNSKRQARGRGYVSGWLILAFLSAFVGGWFLYRLLFRPEWPGALPPAAAELLNLVELAAAFTLIVLWAGLLWRRRASQASTPGKALNLDQMYALSPKAFEHYVAGLFRRRGYRVIVRGRSGDHGVDLELSGGGRRAIVQCKRYRDTVGEEIVRGLFGTLLHETAHHAFLVTTADISEAARNWAAGKPMTLIDGPTLVNIAAAIDGRSRQ
jgi:HJR/Mrr/RecB family endonuclease